MMSGTTMHVKGTRMDGTTVDGHVAIPADGVVYVANDGACQAYTPVDSDARRRTAAATSRSRATTRRTSR